MSVAGYIRRKLFWRNNPEIFADYVSTLDIIKNPNEANKECIAQRLEALMKHAENIQMWQFVQDSKNEYCLKVVPMKGVVPTEEDVLLPQLKELLGQDAKIRFELSDEIPTTNSQKRRYTVNLYKPQ